jgi:rhodanese-related sulfurtransferase
MNTQEIIQKKLGTIVDVRSRGEFLGGHAEGSVNIPLDEIPSKIAELQKLKAPLLLCCASGNRSGQAERFLAQYGLDVRNAGPWINCL